MKYNDGWQYPVRAILNITDACNMRCKYCFVEHNPHTMNYETAKKTVDWLVQNYEKQIKNNWYGEKQYEGCSLYFFGGEPTLCFYNIIEPIVQYCNETYPLIPFQYGITTNCLQIDDYMIDFFKQYNFGILVSMDGIKQVQDYNRLVYTTSNQQKSSFDLIIKNVKKLLEKIPDISVRGTVIPDTCEYLFASYLFFEECGFTRINFAPNIREEWTKEKIQILEEQINKIFVYRTNQFLLGKLPAFVNKINFIYEEILYHDLFNINNKFFTFLAKDIESKTHIRCGTGVGDNGVAIGFDGKIYGCQEQPSHSEKNIFLIGDVFQNGINKQKHKDLILKVYETTVVQKDKYEQCIDCPLSIGCRKYNTCISTNYELEKNFHPQKNNFNCVWDNIFYNQCLSQMKILTDKNCDIFKKYIYNLSFYKIFLIK